VPHGMTKVTVRRFLLTLIIVSSAGWSQPAQQQAQPPIVVQVAMPPTNPWARIMELVIPGIIGAGLALFGVWLTNRSNAATNAANRRHALDVERIKDEIAAEAKSRDNRWEFRKDVYVNLIEATTTLVSVYSTMKTYHTALLANPPLTADPLFARKRSETTEAFGQAMTRLNRYSDLAPLAMAEDVLPLIREAITEKSEWVEMNSPDHVPYLRRQLALFTELRSKLQAAGRRELWGAPEGEAKVCRSS